ncbi:MAG: hypothetical protein RIC16_02070 [Rhodospirillales bacterium]
MVSLVQKSNDAVHGNVALTAFQTAIRQQAEFKEAVEESKEREREAEAQRQREAEERLSMLADGASIDDSASATDDGTTSDQGGQATEGRGGTVDVAV